jgi:hypothetical protein
MSKSARRKHRGNIWLSAPTGGSSGLSPRPGRGVGWCWQRCTRYTNSPATANLRRFPAALLGPSLIPQRTGDIFFVLFRGGAVFIRPAIGYDGCTRRSPQPIRLARGWPLFCFQACRGIRLCVTNPANCPRLRRNRQVSGDAEREAGLDEASNTTKRVSRPCTGPLQYVPALAADSHISFSAIGEIGLWL